MSSKHQRAKEAAKEKAAGERLPDGTRPPGPGGRPDAQIRCLHCDRLLMKIPPRVPRWKLRGVEIKCPKCGRLVTL